MKCNIKNIEINYETYGHGKPIIMIHGYCADHRLMTGCLEPIFNGKDNYKRIYIDLPGMGKTKSADWITNIDIMLDVIIMFIEKVIPNQNFLLAGESYGGYISRGLICKMKDRIDGVLLICPAITINGDNSNVPQHIVLEKDDKLLSSLTPEDARIFNSDFVIQNKNIYERYKNELLCGLRIADYRFLIPFQKNGFKFSFDVDGVNGRFDKPSLILLGRQDSCVGYKDAWNILDNFPRATFAILDKGGHNLQIEQAELFNDLVSDWIKRVKSYCV